MLADTIKAWPGQLEFNQRGICYTAGYTADRLLAAVYQSAPITVCPGVSFANRFVFVEAADISVYQAGVRLCEATVETLDYCLAASGIFAASSDLQRLEDRILG